MNRYVRLVRSSIGHKLLMAVTGLLLGLFVIGHMSGNLLILKGPEAFNAYAAYLQHHPLLWVFRIGLLAIFGVHIGVGVKLYLANQAARGVGYSIDATVEASLSSRHMVLSGLLVLLFVIYHLLHFTIGAIDPGGFHGQADAQGRHDVYTMVVNGFRDPLVAGSYLAGMLVLAFHLLHGIRSLFETLGTSGQGARGLARGLAPALVVVVIGGFCMVPLSVLIGLVGSTTTGGGS